MSALDTTVEIAPSISWGSAWLDRTLPSLFRGATYAHYILSLSVIAVTVFGSYKNWRLQEQLKQDDVDRPRLLKQVEERVAKMTRRHFFIANIYLLGILLISGVDAFIAFVSLKNVMDDHSEIWTPTFVLELAGLVAGSAVLFSAVFFLVPFVQVCLSFWFLARFARKRGEGTLASYIPQARSISTSMALLFASASFIFQAWTSPTDSGVWRWVLLQGGIGSAVAWLDVSFAFIFRAHRLGDKKFELSTIGVKDVVAMFSKTMLEVHAKGGCGTVLPNYQAVPQETGCMDEKAGA